MTWRWSDRFSVRVVSAPSWLSGVSVGQWYSVPNSAPNSTPGSTTGINLDLSGLIAAGTVAANKSPIFVNGTYPYGHPCWYRDAGVFGNFQGGCFRQRDASLMASGGGGDGQWAGNEVHSISLLSETPAWTVLNTPVSFKRIFRRYGVDAMNGSNQGPSWKNSCYYADRDVINNVNDPALPSNYDLIVGQLGYGAVPSPENGPIAGHSYSTLQHNEVTDETIKYGSHQTWGTDAGRYGLVHRLNRAQQKWDAGYYPLLVTSAGGITIDTSDSALAYDRVADPNMGWLYYAAGNNIYRRPPFGTSTADDQLFYEGYVFNDPANFGCSAVDTTTGRLVTIRRSPSTGTQWPTKIVELDGSTIPATRYDFTVTGTYADELKCGDIPEYNYWAMLMCYVPSWSGWKGILFDKMDGHLYRLTRNTGNMTYSVDRVTTTASTQVSGLTNGWTKPPNWMGVYPGASKENPRNDGGRRMFYSRLLGGVVRLANTEEPVWFLRTN